MFNAKKLADTDTLKRLASEWSTMNWLRSLIVLVGIVFSYLAIDRIYATKHREEA